MPFSKKTSFDVELESFNAVNYLLISMYRTNVARRNENAAKCTTRKGGRARTNFSFRSYRQNTMYNIFRALTREKRYERAHLLTEASIPPVHIFL